ncbi:MAG TPA: RNA polymerase sigma-70 factor [Acidobacteriaceae bacterium]|nr:RNA polymerase sigma-70 factor [Acidobacteriaceae bacterium]
MESHDTNTFSEQRRYLLSVAYRMTGSMSDAEDLLQEAFLRWQQASAQEIRSPRAFLTTIVVRLALNHLDSARVRREQYIGEWLPEPVLTTTTHDPVELAESLTMAFLVLLESLTPPERAVFLLHEVFDFSHTEIAAILDKSEPSCRQLLTRAKQAVRQRRPRFAPAPAAAAELTEQFTTAMKTGNLGKLMSLMHEDIVIYSDGGGQTSAALNPIAGKDRASRFLAGITRKNGDGITRRFAEINGQPGILAFNNGKARGAAIFDMDHDRIRTIYIVVNPDKLHHLPKEEQA